MTMNVNEHRLQSGEQMLAGTSDPSSSSSLSNSVRHGEKRKRDGGQPPPLAHNPVANETLTTRERVVEILSNTANGCLSELGYFPGMPAKLKELEMQNVKWKDENVKLYQDNQQLTAMLRALNTNDMTQKILDLQNEVKQLEVENEQNRKLLEHPQAERAKFVEKYNQLLHSYRLAYQENLQLKTQINAMIHNQQSSRMHQQVQQSTQPPFPSTSYSPMALPDNNTQQPQRVQVGQFQFQGQQSPSAHSPSQLQQRPLDQGQRNQLTQTQHAVLQNRQPSNSNPSSRRSSLHGISPTVQSPQVPFQTYNTEAQPNIEAQMLAMQKQYHALDNTRQMVPFGNDHTQNMRRASVPIVPNQRGKPYPVPFGQPTRISSNPANSRPGSATPTIFNQSPRNSPPVLPNASHILAERPTFGRPPTGSPTEVSQNNMGQPVQPVATTISPQDTYINPPVQLPLASVSPHPLSAQDAPMQGIQHVNTPPIIPSPHASTPFSGAPFAHPNTPFGPPGSRSSPNTTPVIPSPHASTPLPGAPFAHPNTSFGPPGSHSSPNTTPVIPSPHASTPLSGAPFAQPNAPLGPLGSHSSPNATPVIPSPHASTSLSGAPFANPNTPLGPFGSHSSPKPESPPDNTQNNPQPAEQPPSENTPPEPAGGAAASQNLPSPVAMQVDAPQDAEEEDDESEEEIELGPDGLRTVKDCLFTLFGDPIDGRVTCKLCQSRFEAGFLDEPPVPFVNASDKELEDHCLAEHEDPWQMLRNPETE